jgi:hypothetical protein
MSITGRAGSCSLRLKENRMPRAGRRSFEKRAPIAGRLAKAFGHV